MKRLHVLAGSGRSYRLMIDGREAGGIQYDKWYSCAATLTVNGEKFSLVPANSVFSSEMILSEADQPLMRYAFAWTGSVSIRSAAEEKSWTWTLKQMGFFNYRYQLKDEHKEVLMNIRPAFRWSAMKYDYEVEVTDKMAAHELYLPVVLMVIHACEYYKTYIAGGA